MDSMEELKYVFDYSEDFYFIREESFQNSCNACYTHFDYLIDSFHYTLSGNTNMNNGLEICVENISKMIKNIILKIS
ncbi:PIR Superfamily Protein [Plasmodium malariae]|uniref:PIR Superfamily Protein n=1 Tax=Plasmodium malariae TaxID=5858 RepID=A0A1A8X183_PLAMA|nr:PIR Superfamily Protein [Plasmodium malariae]